MKDSVKIDDTDYQLGNYSQYMEKVNILGNNDKCKISIQ